MEKTVLFNYTKLINCVIKLNKWIYSFGKLYNPHRQKGTGKIHGKPSVRNTTLYSYIQIEEMELVPKQKRFLVAYVYIV